jgi:oxygen-independent coproporphyrinogen-3 oxidase
VIERLMCDFTFSARDTWNRFGETARALLADAVAAMVNDVDGFIERTSDGFKLTERGRPFVRNICAQFDAYLPREAGSRRHALSV